MRIQEHIEEKIKGLREKIAVYNYYYYTADFSKCCYPELDPPDSPGISDAEFDALMRELTELEAKHSHLITPDSPTQRVGGEPSKKFKKVEREVPMLSLEAVRSKAAIVAFDKNVRKVLSEEAGDVIYTVELKIDGLAVELEYEDGVFVRGSTRGNGLIGEDITENLKTVQAVPLTLYKPKLVLGFMPKKFIVRGEVFMSKSGLKALNKVREKNGEKLYPDTRSAASATLRRLDPGVTAKSPLNMFCYGVVPVGKYKPYAHGSEVLGDLNFLDFNLNKHTESYKGIDNMLNGVKELKHKRRELDYDVDGVVIKVDTIPEQEKLGNSAKAPNWAVAVKF
ncbi:MAG: hypothetical protein KAT46_05345 [Deltaproteobacteria bacterium]|nr:hypothetical protein [Deltaproteobacteria bacterium]